MMAISPGPWSVNPDSFVCGRECFVRDSRGGMVARGIAVEDNARAIAALPELIQACLRTLEADAISDEEVEGMHDILRVLRSIGIEPPGFMAIPE